MSFNININAFIKYLENVDEKIETLEREAAEALPNANGPGGVQNLGYRGGPEP